ncbi:MAG: Na(+)/H(+) antiporter subunit D [Betaproteobacteria bacterium]|nr:MAG: Na(+)/H(+) antiporter subunit D [Betaproteobacteria bacterium]
MIAELPAGLILVAAGLALPLLPRAARSPVAAAAPLLAFAQLLWIGPGYVLEKDAFGFTLQLVRTDRLSLAFGYIFTIAAFLNAIYAWRVREGIEPPAALVYAGTALAAVFAGDFLTLFIYWELSAVASALIVWAGGSARAYGAGMRYMAVQLGSGMLLAAGAALRYAEAGSLAFEHVGLGSPGGALLFLAFGIKCAFPLLHNWLQDAYPEASATGTVVLSAFTTKLSIYALARGFAGTEMLIWIGAAMTAFPIFYAVIENDLRRVLAYSLNNQLGFMVVGIGLGTDMGLNGAVAHAFAHILYKALLFMSMGAVLLRAGTVKGTELGGLYKSMPLTAGLCMVGAASISAFPLFSAFVSKSMVLVSAAEQGYTFIWLVLVFASAGVFHHSGIKVPFFAFFAHDSGIRCKEAPAHMLVAMALTALLCVGIGVFPGALYAILPMPVDYVPYTASHVLAQLQLLVFSGLAFSWLKRRGIYPPEMRSVNLDADWFYRRLGLRMARALAALLQRLFDAGREASRQLGEAGAALLERLHGSEGVLARTWSTGGMALWAAILLAAYLLLYYADKVDRGFIFLLILPFLIGALGLWADSRRRDDD